MDIGLGYLDERGFPDPVCLYKSKSTIHPVHGLESQSFKFCGIKNLCGRCKDFSRKEGVRRLKIENLGSLEIAGMAYLV
jgi:hypothetical protein